VVWGGQRDSSHCSHLSVFTTCSFLGCPIGGKKLSWTQEKNIFFFHISDGEKKRGQRTSNACLCLYCCLPICCQWPYWSRSWTVLLSTLVRGTTHCAILAKFHRLLWLACAPSKTPLLPLPPVMRSRAEYPHSLLLALCVYVAVFSFGFFFVAVVGETNRGFPPNTGFFFLPLSLFLFTPFPPNYCRQACYLSWASS